MKSFLALSFVFFSYFSHAQNLNRFAGSWDGAGQSLAGDRLRSLMNVHTGVDLIVIGNTIKFTEMGSTYSHPDNPVVDTSVWFPMEFVVDYNGDVTQKGFGKVGRLNKNRLQIALKYNGLTHDLDMTLVNPMQLSMTYQYAELDIIKQVDQVILQKRK